MYTWYVIVWSGTMYAYLCICAVCQSKRNTHLSLPLRDYYLDMTFKRQLTSFHMINLLPRARVSGTTTGFSWTTCTPGFALAMVVFVCFFHNWKVNSTTAYWVFFGCTFSVTIKDRSIFRRETLVQSDQQVAVNHDGRLVPSMILRQRAAGWAGNRTHVAI